MRWAVRLVSWRKINSIQVITEMEEWRQRGKVIIVALYVTTVWASTEEKIKKSDSHHLCECVWCVWGATDVLDSKRKERLKTLKTKEEEGFT